MKIFHFAAMLMPLLAGIFFCDLGGATPAPVEPTRPIEGPVSTPLPDEPAKPVVDRPTPTPEPVPTPAYAGEVIEKNGFSLVAKKDVDFFVKWPWQGEEQLIQIKVIVSNQSGRDVVAEFSPRMFHLTDNANPPTQYEVLLPDICCPGGWHQGCFPVDFKGLWKNGQELEIGCDPSHEAFGCGSGPGYCKGEEKEPAYKVVALRFDANKIPGDATALVLYVEDFPNIGYASWLIPIPR